MNVDVSATRDYYNSITDSALCDCGYCRNYRLQIKSALPEVTAYNPDEEMRNLFERIATSEGMFWRRRLSL